MTERRRRLIEVDFPLRKVSRESSREKNIRHGHISTLHIWWARKPLAASRATTLAALLPDDPARREELLRLIETVSPWEAVQGDNPDLERARALIREAFGGRAPRVLDPFAGGGSMPLEALRLGCETYALDYNPVAALILKATLEYPQRFGRPDSVSFVPLPTGWTKVNGLFSNVGDRAASSPLLEAVEAWSEWVLEEARRELGRFYPEDPDGSIPVGYYWMRTIPCQNPSCGAMIPLTANWWLVKKDERKIALRIVPDRNTKRVDVEIVGQNGEVIDFDPEEGTVARAHVRCPVCGGTIDDDTTRRLFREGKAGQRLMAVVLHNPNRAGKTYRLPTERDLEAYEAAERALEEKRRKLWEEWDMDPVPDELLPEERATGNSGFRVLLYNMTAFGDLFNPRQKLALITFAEKVRQAHAEMLAQGADPEFAKAVVTYLAFIIDRLSDRNSTLCRLIPQTEAIGFTFTRQALPMIWDYIEINPIESQSGWISLLEDMKLIFNHLLQIPTSTRVPQVLQGSATRLPWPNDFFDAVITDPPYYDNVNYSALSDFFYVWLKRTVGELYPDLFATPLTPKSEEIIQDPNRHGGHEKSKAFFEEKLTQAFREVHRVLKPDGIAVVVFAHKTTEAWEAVIKALLEAGLYMTASWPIHTEMESRLNSQETASLASSIYMVCRKRSEEKVGYFAEVRREIERRVRERLAQFWKEGIRGADFFMSAIGPAVEVFGQYSRVEKVSGEAVSVGELLGFVREVVSEFALEQILHSPQLGGVDSETRFYLLWRWTYNHARVHFDEARKLAQSVGVELEKLWGKRGLVKKDKDCVFVRTPQERGPELEQEERFVTMIDALHYALWLWEKNDRKRLTEHLDQTYGANEFFWQIAQAISEVLPEGDKEKQLLQGLLLSRKTTQLGGRRESTSEQGSLFT